MIASCVACSAALDSARRAGNFHLLAQMKVTKAKGLNTHTCGGRGCILSRFVRHRIPSARFLADPSSLRDFIGRKARLVDRRRSVGLRGRLVRLGTRARAKAVAGAGNEFEPLGKRRGRRRQSKRKRPELRGRPESRALTPQMSGQIGIEALCFGDFHLCQQMKVTRPPGRDPATSEPHRLTQRALTWQHRRSQQWTRR